MFLQPRRVIVMCVALDYTQFLLGVLHRPRSSSAFQHRKPSRLLLVRVRDDPLR